MAGQPWFWCCFDIRKKTIVLKVSMDGSLCKLKTVSDNDIELADPCGFSMRIAVRCGIFDVYIGVYALVRTLSLQPNLSKCD